MKRQSENQQQYTVQCGSGEGTWLLRREHSIVFQLEASAAYKSQICKTFWRHHIHGNAVINMFFFFVRTLFCHAEPQNIAVMHEEGCGSVTVGCIRQFIVDSVFVPAHSVSIKTTVLDYMASARSTVKSEALNSKLREKNVPEVQLQAILIGANRNVSR